MNLVWFVVTVLTIVLKGGNRSGSRRGRGRCRWGRSRYQTKRRDVEMGIDKREVERVLVDISEIQFCNG